MVRETSQKAVTLALVQTPEKQRPKLRTPAHGNGKLATSGTLGNRGGGRPASAIRDLCAKSFEERVGILQDIADGKVIQKAELLVLGPDGQSVTQEALVSASPNDRIKAIDLLGKYGLGVQKEVSGEINHKHYTFTVEREGKTG